MVIDLSLCSLDSDLASYACGLISFAKPLLGGLCTVVSSTAQIVSYFQGKKHDFKLSYLKKNYCESFYIYTDDTHEVCAAEGQFLHYATNTGKYSDNRGLGFDMVKDKNSHSCYIYSLLFDENCDKADKLTAGECIDLDHLIIAYC
ncbi:hypothetical protein BCR32DRAFT_280841 [Anaeromyces robustus]|uniref:Uncharacterized protein n=1 Tax=Anaeromyces robustus TaxID=1754192 RepID=A0A1Y1X2Z1_9FUNG|nr:hypothetical protein BCR32DRAFT_280841 [Anaeromyces robustus]|eukprot:ORX80062.1 hypothetical protein BCR32DRAFT_280841 [Anaeromyces robustus]